MCSCMSYNAIAHLKRPCKFACPVNAITYNEYGISVIDDSKCIRCGKCIHSCPFGAIGSKTFMVDVINALKSDKKVYVIAAPATEDSLVQTSQWEAGRKLCRKLDSTDLSKPD